MHPSCGCNSSTRIAGLPRCVTSEAAPDAILLRLAHSDVYQPRRRVWIGNVLADQIDKVQTGQTAYGTDRDLIEGSVFKESYDRVYIHHLVTIYLMERIA